MVPAPPGQREEEDEIQSLDRNEERERGESLTHVPSVTSAGRGHNARPERTPTEARGRPLGWPAGGPGMGRRWKEARPTTAAQWALLAIGALVVVAACTVSLIGLVRFVQQFTG